MQETKKISINRFSKSQEKILRFAMDPEPKIFVPDTSKWRVIEAHFDSNTGLLEGNLQDHSPLLESPLFFLPANTTCYFTLFFESELPSGLKLSLHSVFGTLVERVVQGTGELALSLRFHSKRAGRYHLILANYPQDKATSNKVRLGKFVTHASQATAFKQNISNTNLPHWSYWQRTIHRLCQESRWFNAAIAALEMHLDREEVLSLPQYVAICPTGQCNASCGFCSVTTNRTGVIKKQLPFEALDRFLSPVFGSLRLFGLEGNGEPTLYDRFDELLFRVTSRGAAVYLISNGERLSADQIALLLASPTDAINFSLNAATAETHRRVMKLKGWDNVIRNISRFVRWRGGATAPLLSVSMVVTRDNAHEVQQFLHFAEWQLKVDRILIRPLSEIANDSGVIEDLRELVPYESQINDLLDAVAEYLEYVPRRAEIVIDPSAFNAFRLEPRGVIISPPGFEDQLLAPRKTNWLVESDQVKTQWHLNRLEISAEAPGILARSRVIPVVTGQKMTFRCRAQCRKGTLKIVISDESAIELGASSTTASDTPDLLTIEFGTPPHGGVMIELHACDQSAQVQIDFGHLYSWPVIESGNLKLPHSSRWQMDMPGTSVRWEGNELSLEAQAQPGLYLYRSYKVPTLPQKSVDLSVEVHLEFGALGIGILSDDGNEWLTSARFESESFSTEIGFNTGRYRGFQVVLYALTAAPLRARINWGNNLGAAPEHKNRLIEPGQLLLPIPSLWTVNTKDANVRWSDNTVQIAWNGAKSIYLLQSSPFPCPPLRRPMAKVSLLARVSKGQLGIGFLGGHSNQFASISSFAVGEHNATIEIDSYGQDNLTVVLFSDSSEPLEATVDWGKSLQLELNEAQNDWRGGLFDPREIAPRSHEGQSPKFDGGVDPEANKSNLSKLVKAPGFPRRIANIYLRAGLSGLVRKTIGFLARRATPPSLFCIFGLSFSRLSGKAFNSLLNRRFPKASIYCQKPWTDLNNFTVDGRMDVCCITTGPSQERYALGNIFERDFQQIWNGEQMKEFRRTVNVKEKLPPCARCPMANNYTPPF